MMLQPLTPDGKHRSRIMRTLVVLVAIIVIGYLLGLIYWPDHLPWSRLWLAIAEAATLAYSNTPPVRSLLRPPFGLMTGVKAMLWSCRNRTGAIWFFGNRSHFKPVRK